MISILDAGTVVADGVADDTAQMQAIIDAATTGETILFPAGRAYRINPAKGIKIPKALTFEAHGAKFPTIQNTTAMSRAFVTIPGVRGFRMFGGDVFGAPRYGTGGFVIGFYGDSTQDLLMDGVSFYDFPFDGVYLGGNEGCQNVRLTNITTERCKRNGVAIVKGTKIFVEHSQFSGSSGNPGAGIDVEPNSGDRVTEVTIVDCEFNDNVKGIYAHKGYGLGGSDYTIIGCVVVPAVNANSGIVVNTVTRGVVLGCRVEAGSARAISIGAVTDVRVMDCYARGRDFDFLWAAPERMFWSNLDGRLTISSTPNATSGRIG